MLPYYEYTEFDVHVHINLPETEYSIAGFPCVKGADVSIFNFFPRINKGFLYGQVSGNRG